MRQNCGKGTILHFLHDMPGSAGCALEGGYWRNPGMPKVQQHGFDFSAGGVGSERRTARNAVRPTATQGLGNASAIEGTGYTAFSKGLREEAAGHAEPWGFGCRPSRSCRPPARK